MASAAQRRAVPAVSDQLTEVVRMASGRLEELGYECWRHPRLRQIFPEYQFRLYCTAIAGVPLMQAALDRASTLAPRCAVSARLIPYLKKHIDEEAGHADDMLDDMNVLGVERSQVMVRTPPGEVAASMGSVYYWIFHVHPVAVLAYLFLVEGNPFDREVLDEARTRTGLPREAFRTMYAHAELDIVHGEELRVLIDDLPLTPQHEALLRTCTLTMLEHSTQMMERLLWLADHAATRLPFQPAATLS